MSSFSGKIKEFPQISVDRFDGRNLASTAYFLSHAHSDHMVGLSSPQFLDHLESNSGVYLYCSSITARFLQASIRHRPLDPFVRPLPHEESVKITVPNVAEEASHQLCVTLIPAGHCPGSVMFLFEGRGGTVLYTGDFRTSVGDVERIRSLHNTDGTVKTVDSLHIDTTFCHRDILHFPTREESAAAIGDLVEEWLARGNNHLIHLVCPAKYGYEYVYRSLHERFGMRVHVSRWKYRMYDTVPEIQDALTPDATETWVHACDWTINEVEEGEGGDHPAVRQLPCRCVPFGVDTAPSIRVIRPSAMFYTVYQSAKEVKQVVRDGSFCRVLLSMHASCSEVLDLVSYLRPRKVYPNVIPTNSTREEVLKLLHEALNRSGDHYSIEYGGAQQRRSLGSFKRQLQSNESSSSSTLEAVMYDGFLASPSKRRRHSDSNVTLVLPTPRGNMKGSLSLEGEAQRCETNTAASNTTANAATPGPSPGPSLEWVDPYSPSPTSPRSSPYKFPDIPTAGQEDGPGLRPNCPVRVNLTARMESDGSGGRQVIVKARVPSVGPGLGLGSGGSQMSVDGDVEDDTDSHSVISFVKTSQDSIELASVFSEEARESPGPASGVCVERPASSAGVAGESAMKRSRKLWYTHKHFSTPVHDDPEKTLKTEPKPPLGPRSSSLPLPSPRHASPPLSPGPALPLITVSSPSDPASAESQVSDETSVTAILSNSDLDVMSVDVDPDPPQPPDRPSVICGPAVGAGVGVAPRGEGGDGADFEDLLLRSRRGDERTSCLKTTRRRDNEVEVVTLDQQTL